MANLLIIERALDANGYVSPGAKATIYLTGTTTLIDVYSDRDGTIAAANPIIADGNGFWPQRYVTETPKAVVTTSADVSLYTLDPVPATFGTGAAAAGVSFDPTAEVPENNVQAAIESVAATVVGGLTAYGIGVTGNAPLLANIDATGTASGVYRWDGASTGTFPAGISAATTGLIDFDRQTSAQGMMTLRALGQTRTYVRFLNTTWGAWREEANVADGSARGALIRKGASAWESVALGTSGQVLTSNGTDALWGSSPAVPITWEALVSTSGAGPISVSTTLPATATEIYFLLNGASLSGSDNIIIQLGTAGSWITSGYDAIGTVSGGASGGATATNGALVFGGVGSRAYKGLLSFYKFTAANAWVWTVGGHDGVNAALGGGGTVTTTDQPTRIRIDASGGNTFDAGNVRVGYR